MNIVDTQPSNEKETKQKKIHTNQITASHFGETQFYEFIVFFSLNTKKKTRKLNFILFL